MKLEVVRLLDSAMEKIVECSQVSETRKDINTIEQDYTDSKSYMTDEAPRNLKLRNRENTHSIIGSPPKPYIMQANGSERRDIPGCPMVSVVTHNDTLRSEKSSRDLLSKSTPNFEREYPKRRDVLLRKVWTSLEKQSPERAHALPSGGRLRRNKTQPLMNSSHQGWENSTNTDTFFERQKTHKKPSISPLKNAWEGREHKDSVFRQERVKDRKISTHVPLYIDSYNKVGLTYARGTDQSINHLPNNGIPFRRGSIVVAPPSTKVSYVEPILDFPTPQRQSRQKQTHSESNQRGNTGLRKVSDLGMTKETRLKRPSIVSHRRLSLRGSLPPEATTLRRVSNCNSKRLEAGQLENDTSLLDDERVLDRMRYEVFNLNPRYPESRLPTPSRTPWSVFSRYRRGLRVSGSHSPDDYELWFLGTESKVT